MFIPNKIYQMRLGTNKLNSNMPQDASYGDYFCILNEHGKTMIIELNNRCQDHKTESPPNLRFITQAQNKKTVRG